MAANGLRLERFYVSPICSPTRAAALTGRIPDRTGVFDQGRPLNLQEQKTLARALRDAGWATGLFGAILPGVRTPNAHPTHSQAHADVRFELL
eukprot:4888698-Prymnesium_polylepis.1